MIRAVTFDVGGTLIRPAPSVGHIYAEVAVRSGCAHIAPEELNRRFTAAWARLRNFAHRYDQWAALVDETFAGLTKAPPSETFFPELYEKFAQPDAWAIFPDVEPALEQLVESGVQLGVVSNWDDRLRPLMRKLGLDSYFPTVIVSCETGCCKPAAGIFRAAARALGLPASQILHVGDSPEMDLLGAQRAGMRAVLVRRTRKHGRERLPRPARPAPAGRSINALTELLPLL